MITHYGLSWPELASTEAALVDPGEPTTDNDYSSRFHAITANRNATRAIKIKILVMAASFSLSPIFFSNLRPWKFH
jgi:hypothetical protein